MTYVRMIQSNRHIVHGELDRGFYLAPHPRIQMRVGGWVGGWTYIRVIHSNRHAVHGEVDRGLY